MNRWYMWVAMVSVRDTYLYNTTTENSTFDQSSFENELGTRNKEWDTLCCKDTIYILLLITFEIFSSLGFSLFFFLVAHSFLRDVVPNRNSDMHS